MSSLDRFDALTDRDTRFVYDRKGKRAGAVIHVANGKFAAWGLKGKVGEFADALKAEEAVKAAQRPK
jgi:hypothetical protein